MSLNPPFRADHVGSFLRPAYLLEARERKARGEITPEQLQDLMAGGQELAQLEGSLGGTV